MQTLRTSTVDIPCTAGAVRLTCFSEGKTEVWRGELICSRNYSLGGRARQESVCWSSLGAIFPPLLSAFC